MGSERMAIVVVTGVLCGLVALSLWANPARHFPIDDAYITLSNARMLLGGVDASYGATSPTAATSVLHLALLGGAGTILPLVAANHLLLAFFAALYALGLVRLLRACGADPILAMLLAVVGLTAGAAWYQLMNGLETGMAMAAVTWAAVFLVTRRDVPLGMLCGILPFIRPELAILSAALGAAVVWCRFRIRASLVPVIAALAASGTVGTALALWTTGAIVPQTAGAKLAFFAEANLPADQKLRIVALILGTSVLAPILVGLLALHRLPRGGALSLFVLALLAAAAVSMPGGLGHNHSRYLYVLLPLGLAGLTVAAGRSPAFRTGLGLLALGYVALFPVHGWKVYRESLAVTAEQSALAAWSLAHLPGDARILIHDAGYVAWRTEFALIDLVGLKTPSSVVVHRDLTLPSGGQARGVAIARIAAATQPSHAIILDDPFWSQIADAMRTAGWRLDPLREDPAARYQVFSMTPPAGPGPDDGLAAIGD